MSYDVSNLERFPISQEVMPFFFYSEHEFLFFDFSRVYNFALIKPRKMLNGSPETLLGLFL